jgi:hypothetical protein
MSDYRVVREGRRIIAAFAFGVATGTLVYLALAETVPKTPLFPAAAFRLRKF